MRSACLIGFVVCASAAPTLGQAVGDSIFVRSDTAALRVRREISGHVAKGQDFWSKL